MMSETQLYLTTRHYAHASPVPSSQCSAAFLPMMNDEKGNIVHASPRATIPGIE